MKTTPTLKTFIISGLAVATILAPLALAHAQLDVTTGANVSANAAIGTVAKGKGDAMIQARIDSLNDLLTRVGQMTKVSASEQASLDTTINANLSDMTNLQAKINSDTSKAILKTDVQSITKSYRVYALILPQIRILAAADRISDTVDILTSVQTKLQVGITQAQTSGKDVTAIESTNADMTAKLADASAKGQAAVTLVTPLQPDQGSASVAASNKTALGSARTDIKTSISDLVTALQDAKTMQSSLISLGVTVQ
jgi:hypothetical protein